MGGGLVRPCMGMLCQPMFAFVSVFAETEGNGASARATQLTDSTIPAIKGSIRRVAIPLRRNFFIKVRLIRLALIQSCRRPLFNFIYQDIHNISRRVVLSCLIVG
jgi:hypothetical protein